MEANSLRGKLESGAVLLGAQCLTASPSMVEVLGGIGFDFVWVDYEHGGGSISDTPRLEDLARAALVGQTELLFRVPGSESAMIKPVLDAGIRCILIPGIVTHVEIEKAIRASKYVYSGKPGLRGLGAVRSNRWGLSSREWAETEDRSVLVGAMIENSRAVSDLDRILGVSDLGFVYIGPSDLSVSLGCPAEANNPLVAKAIHAIEEAALEARIPMGTGVSSLKSAREALARGYRIVRVGGDIASVRETLSARLRELRQGGQATLH